MQRDFVVFEPIEQQLSFLLIACTYFLMAPTQRALIHLSQSTLTFVKKHCISVDFLKCQIWVSIGGRSYKRKGCRRDALLALGIVSIY